MAKRAKFATLEVPEDTGNESPEPLETQDDATVESAEDSGTAGNEPAETENADAEEAKPDVPAELTQEEKIAAYIRKEQVLRDAQSDLNSLEDQQAEARREMNSYKKPISDARAKVERLISCDVSGFLVWEKEQELPLIRKAEEAANAWKMFPVDKLDLPKGIITAFTEHGFDRVVQVSDWYNLEYRDKIKGVSKSGIEKIGTALEKLIEPYHAPILAKQVEEAQAEREEVAA